MSGNTYPKSRWLALWALIPFGYFFVALQCSPDFSGQFNIVRSVNPTPLDGHGSEVIHGIAWDLGFIASWVIIVWLLKLGALHWIPPFRRWLPQYRYAWSVALAALILDLLEDLLLWISTISQPVPFLIVLATVGWVKLAAYVASIMGVLVIVVGGTIGRLLGWCADWLFNDLVAWFKKDLKERNKPSASASTNP